LRAPCWWLGSAWGQGADRAGGGARVFRRARVTLLGMKAVVGRRFILIFGLAMFATHGCGGRSGLIRSADAKSSEPDTNLAAPANDALGGPEAADSALAIDGTARPVDLGADGRDARAVLNCTQAQRQSAPCPSSEWYAFQGDTRCFLCASSVAPGCSSHVTTRAKAGATGFATCYAKRTATGRIHAFRSVERSCSMVETSTAGPPRSPCA
jgi:hypothetical protein